MASAMFAFDLWPKRLTIKALWHRLRSVPMLLVALCFALGIIVADSFLIPFWVATAAIVITTIVAWLALPRYSALVYLGIALVMLGYVVSVLRQPTTAVPYDSYGEMVVEVRGVPSARDGYRVAEGRLLRFEDVSADDRVQLWLRSDSVAEGDRLTLYAKLVAVMSRYEGYNELLCRRGYVGGVGVADYNILAIEHNKAMTLQHRALRKLGRYHRDSASHATVEAMVAGSKADMRERERTIYARTGLSHLMAVSGMHLGIVALVVAWLLAPLSLVHRGHRVRNILVIILIWLFAFVSGASPSVLRAAVMFSVVQLALFSSSRYATLNALAATIFLMLCYRPDYLYDVSFQLSVAAVFGIVAWAVPLFRYFAHLATPWRLLVTTLAIGVAASLWTMPIVSHHFHNLPLIGVVVTPLIMPISYVVVASGVVALVVPGVCAVPFIAVAEWAAWLQNWAVSIAAMPRWAAIDYTISGWGVALIYALYAIITLIMWSVERKKVITL